jgi:hypothetical protein
MTGPARVPARFVTSLGPGLVPPAQPAVAEGNVSRTAARFAIVAVEAIAPVEQPPPNLRPDAFVCLTIRDGRPPIKRARRADQCESADAPELESPDSV